MDEFGCFYESESLNDAPLIEATTESAPVCLRRPRRARWTRPKWISPETRSYHAVNLWLGCTVMPTGPPYRLAA